MGRRIRLFASLVVALGGLAAVQAVLLVWVRGEWTDHAPVSLSGLALPDSTVAVEGGLYEGSAALGQTRQGYYGNLPVPGPLAATLCGLTIAVAGVLLAVGSRRVPVPRARALSVTTLWASAAMFALAWWAGRAWRKSCCAEVGPGVTVWQVGAGASVVGAVVVVAAGWSTRRTRDAAWPMVVPLAPWPFLFMMSRETGLDVAVVLMVSGVVVAAGAVTLGVVLVTGLGAGTTRRIRHRRGRRATGAGPALASPPD